MLAICALQWVRVPSRAPFIIHHSSFCILHWRYWVPDTFQIAKTNPLRPIPEREPSAGPARVRSPKTANSAVPNELLPVSSLALLRLAPLGC